MVEGEARGYITRRFGVQVVRTWSGIAEALGMGVRTVQRYAYRAVDPMPIRKEEASGQVWIPYSELLVWADRNGLGLR